MSSSATTRRRYDWNDYQSWPDDQRWEIIGGEAFAMSPAPQPRHQLIAGEIFATLHTHLSGKPCKAIMAPVDVRLSAEDIVQPDVVVVCRPDQIKCSAETVGMDSHPFSRVSRTAAPTTRERRCSD